MPTPARRATLFRLTFAIALFLSACSDHRATLSDARAGFATRLLRMESGGEAPIQPPPGVLDLWSNNSSA